MREDAEQALLELGVLATGAQRGAENALVAGDRALRLPALPIDSAVESAAHLTSVAGLGPATAAGPWVDGDHRGADAELLATEDVVSLAVVTRVGQEPVDVDERGGLWHRDGQGRGVRAGSQPYVGADHEVGLRQDHERELRPPTPWGVA